MSAAARSLYTSQHAREFRFLLPTEKTAWPLSVTARRIIAERSVLFSSGSSSTGESHHGRCRSRFRHPPYDVRALVSDVSTSVPQLAPNAGQARESVLRGASVKFPCRSRLLLRFTLGEEYFRPSRFVWQVATNRANAGM